MKAVVIRRSGGPEVLAIEERPSPVLGAGEVRIEVAAAGLNRADVLQRKGFYPAPPGVAPDVPGLEYAGTIIETGEGVERTRVGDRVMGLVAGGAMAGEIVAPVVETMPIPEDLSLVEAAAIPEAFVTAWDAARIQGGLAGGGTLLVHAVGSGVGTAAIQLARACGARSIGTSRSDAKLARCTALGMDEGIVVPKGEARFADRVAASTGGAGADVILDTVGAAYLEENLRALARRGTLVVIGLLGGATGSLPMGMLLGKRARIIGTVLRTRDATEKAVLTAAFARQVLPLFASAALAPVVGRIVPMADIADAHAAMERDETFGKVVLVW